MNSEKRVMPRNFNHSPQERLHTVAGLYATVNPIRYRRNLDFTAIR